MKSVIVGLGEIGHSLYRALVPYYRETTLVGRNGAYDKGNDILHITFPYSDSFSSQVAKYQEFYTPAYTVIHSTVPPGTSRKLGAIHSPIIGIHPHLEESLKTFTKFLGGTAAHMVADYFRKAGIKVYLFDNPETTELMKILDTTFYGVCVEYTKEVKRQCAERGVPFEAWSLWVDAYNRGYEKLGYGEFRRPNLVPIMTLLGGHCVKENCDFLDSRWTKLIKELNTT